ncbi:OLC1v1011827C1 [Oldenlandia corymbosa var. corymbosa]|nr:OLC1v1011827C1 [Oldenlandia corymbosa var. corymbosa]
MSKEKRRDTKGGKSKHLNGLTKKHVTDVGKGLFVGFCGPPKPKKVRFCEVGRDEFDQKTAILFSNQEPQDADYSISNNPSLDYQVESLIFARLPRWEHWKLCLLNKRNLNLVRSGEIFKIRREIKSAEPSVCMLASGESSWWMFDGGFESRRKLPVVPSDVCFHSGDKESVCAGTQLLVSGREIDGIVIWRYELAINKWFKGPSMRNPRCLFASTTCGNYAFVAGGIGASANSRVYDTAEMYNPETGSWETLPRMKRRRKLCSGCFMDDRFYVVGGRNELGELTCGEYFDQVKNQWILIPDMLKDDPVLTCHSPPLIAVANNELYSIEASSNQLKLYLKKSNTWKPLGLVPVRADCNRGWGVAFKSLGNELVVIGGALSTSSMVASGSYGGGDCMAIYSCRPDPEACEQTWKAIDSGRYKLSHFIMNCSIMFA